MEREKAFVEIFGKGVFLGKVCIPELEFYSTSCTWESEQVCILAQLFKCTSFYFMALVLVYALICSGEMENLICTNLSVC